MFLSKSLLHRPDTIILMRRATGSAPPQVPVQGLSSCGPPRTPCLLASWSGPAAPRCFSCTDTTRGGGISTPPLGTTAARTILMLVLTLVIFYVVTSILVFYITAFFDFRQWLIQTSDILVSCFSTISPFLLLLRDPRTARICS